MKKITKDMMGCIKSAVEPRDWLVRSVLNADDALPSKFTIQGEQTPIRSQGHEGSCAGFAGAAVKEWEEKKDTKKFLRLSPRYIYQLAKNISGHSEGTTLKAICQVLYGKGICTESDWPYVANEVGEPGPNTEINAPKYKIKGYARVANIDELKRAMYNGYPAGGSILCGILLYKGAVGEQAQMTGVTPDPTCMDRLRGPLGGHALVAVGWEDNSNFYPGDGHIMFKGSWGKDFGAAGYHFFSYKNLKKNMMDAMAMVDIEGSELPMIVGDTPKQRDDIWL